MVQTLHAPAHGRISRSDNAWSGIKRWSTNLVEGLALCAALNLAGCGKSVKIQGRDASAHDAIVEMVDAPRNDARDATRDAKDAEATDAKAEREDARTTDVYDVRDAGSSDARAEDARGSEVLDGRVADSADVNDVSDVSSDVLEDAPPDIPPELIWDDTETLYSQFYPPIGHYIVVWRGYWRMTSLGGLEEEDRMFGDAIHPTWCPYSDGVETAMHIAFQGIRNDGTSQIFQFRIEYHETMDPPGGRVPYNVDWGIRPLVPLTPGPSDKDPQCTTFANGRIFYICGDDICRVNIDGTDLTTVYSDPTLPNKRSPTPSHYQDRLVFSAEIAPGAPRIFAIDLVDGIGVGPAVMLGPPDEDRSWPSLASISPIVAFNIPIAGVMQVATASSLDGSGLAVLTMISSNNTPSISQPDNRHIVFSSNIFGGSAIYRVDLDGSSFSSLTFNPHPDPEFGDNTQITPAELDSRTIEVPPRP